MTHPTTEAIERFMGRLSVIDPDAIPAELRCGSRCIVQVECASYPIGSSLWRSPQVTSVLGIPVVLDPEMERDAWELRDRAGRVLRKGKTHA